MDAGAGRQRGKTKGIAFELNKNAFLYLMAVPGLVVLFFFNYLPMAGVLIAFKNFDFGKGIFGSEWTKPIFNNFNFLFTSDTTFRATRNTILLNLLFIASSTVVAVGLALLLNEVRKKRSRSSFNRLPCCPFSSPGSSSASSPTASSRLTRACSISFCSGSAFRRSTGITSRRRGRSS